MMLVLTVVVLVLLLVLLLLVLVLLLVLLRATCEDERPVSQGNASLDLIATGCAALFAVAHRREKNKKQKKTARGYQQGGQISEEKKKMKKKWSTRTQFWKNDTYLETLANEPPKMLEVSLLEVGMVLRLEKDCAWSTDELPRQKQQKSNPPSYDYENA